MFAKDFRAKAREALRGNWFPALLTTFVAGLLGVFGSAASSGSSAFGSVAEEAGITWSNVWDVLGGMDTRVVLVLTIIAGAIASVTAIWGLARFLLGGALTLGYRSYTLHLVSGEKADFMNLFGKFDMFIKGFVMQLLMDIFLTLWTLLFIIPGIVKAYSYAMTPYILLDHPELTPAQAITASRQLMKGNKWRLFCLQLSFIGWGILCIFTLGIGNLWLRPYAEVSEAAFYRQIVTEKAPRYWFVNDVLQI